MPSSSLRSCFRLLALPPELRNHIYELVLHSDRAVYRGIVYLDERDERLWKPPALLCTSRQVRAEASPLYYAQTIFSVEDRRIALDWLKVIEPKWTARIARLKDASECVHD